MTTVAAIIAARQARWDEQEKINVRAGDQTLPDQDLALALLAQIRRQNADVPAFARDRWDSWQLVRVKKDLTTKAGLMFKAGDVTLGRFEHLRVAESRVPHPRWTVYSLRGRLEVQIGSDNLVESL
jgi:hypothetical protein